MKYTRLTKEQLEELNQEFINFLATQSITAEEWKDIKEQKPKVAEEELDVFSDLVWEGVLSKVEYLENIAPQHMYLFKVDGLQLRLIGLKIKSDNIDLTTKEGFGWLRDKMIYSPCAKKSVTLASCSTRVKTGPMWNLAATR